ncbi:12315_t:CDS:2 [Acaulospora colombiana]|uniref:12315_t:CDS:1 n=1 Tax=Acaulospora colombiana TaxID=27376 RepID=A0ACA9LB42_9GLOM|nr:12315_t:CDS:2 [Acaulospora colombiana]
MTTPFPPETIEKIFKNLDTKSLYSSALVNRKWCRNAVDLLWQNPLELACTCRSKAISIVKTYLSCLPDKSKHKLHNAGVDFIHDLTSSPSFKYASFLNKLNYSLVIKSIGYLLSSNIKGSDIENYLRCIFVELCELFFGQSRRLRSFEYVTGGWDFDGMDKGDYVDLQDLRGADMFFANLQRFSCRGKIPPDLVDSISQKSNALRNLEVCQANNEDAILKLMNAKYKLHQLTITEFVDTPEISSALIRNSKSLRRAVIHGKLDRSLTVFTQFSNLEELSLIYYPLPEIPESLSLAQVFAYLQARTQSLLAPATEVRVVPVHAQRRRSMPSDGAQEDLSCLRESGIMKNVNMQLRVSHSYALQIQIENQIRRSRSRHSLPSQICPPETLKCFLNSNLTTLAKLEIYLKDQFLQNFVHLIRNSRGNLRVINLIILNPPDPQNSSNLFTTIINNCPKLIELSLEIPNESITEIPDLFKKCPSLEAIHLLGNPIERVDISELLVHELAPLIPFNLKSLSLGPFFWTYTKDAINSFMKGCETRLKDRPCDFTIGYNLPGNVATVLVFYKTRGLINLVKG